ncbi:hypothetical protein F5J12DRAFT_244857 [Pisolithus orientalis]|uniref:uncharacterized protein n=1 Tax=Pisolithus orientalis TaxID=936130 RepID=UPI002224B38A|nr:uncharacterized protein F5J12DRAFT_244857 [Pisolithus orientalis]KAI6000946.1 hypothetical protein F5J12DRAFT_244857 [Pisolithus orientalis]
MSSSSFNAELTLGPALVGTTLASCLFGCSVIQTFGYYRRFPSDSTIIKTLVGTIMLLTLAHIVCVIYWTWIVTVTAFGKPNEVTIFTPSRGANLVITPFICYLVQVRNLDEQCSYTELGSFHQLFFAFRLYRFSGSWLLSMICFVLGGISFVGTLVDAARALNRQSLEGNMNAQYWLTILTLVSGAMCDLIITTGLVFHLRKQRAKTKISRTIDLLDKLTVWSIETGLVTSINAVLVTISFSLQRTTFIWSALYIVLADVYTNTFLAALNSRTPHVEHDITQGAVLSTFIGQAAMSNVPCDAASSIPSTPSLIQHKPCDLSPA